MPDSEAPVETVEPPSSRTSIVDSVPSESDSLSDYDYEISVPPSPVSSSSESQLTIPTYTLSPIEGYERIRIPLEQNLQQMLIKITETEDLASVTSLRLRVIANDFSLQRVPVYLPHLTELNLDGSALMSLRDLGCDMGRLKVLRVTRTGINSLDGIAGFPLLVELHAGYNNITTIVPCSRLTHIEVLDLKKNAMSGVNAVSFLELCPTLKHLILAENPVALLDSYRRIIRGFLPGLITLDDIVYEQKDRLTKSEADTNSTRITSRFPVITSRNLQKDAIDKDTTMKRPSTADALAYGRNGRLKSLPVRPATARPAKESDFASIVNGSHLKLKDIRTLFVPSELTSGSPMCGNPALALLQKRRTQAWTEN